MVKLTSKEVHNSKIHIKIDGCINVDYLYTLYYTCICRTDMDHPCTAYVCML